MAAIDNVLAGTGSNKPVFVDTPFPNNQQGLIDIDALNSQSVVYVGNDEAGSAANNINLGSIVSVGALSNTNIVATHGANVTLNGGLLPVNVVAPHNYFIDGASSININAGTVSVFGSANTTIAFSGKAAGTFTFTAPNLSVSSAITLNVAEMQAGDKIHIPFTRPTLDVLSPPNAYDLREISSNAWVPGTGANAGTGTLRLVNGPPGALGLLRNQVFVDIKMTTAQYNLYLTNKSAWLNAGADTFTLVGPPEDNDLPDNVVPCFVRGTMIMTDKGPVAVENLSVGDMVMTKDNGPQPIRWVGSKVIGALALANYENIRPIRIKQGALGKGLPNVDLFVSPQHRILVRSTIVEKMFDIKEVLIAAKQLLQVEGIDVVHDMTEVEYFHILLDRHEVILSNGAETETLFTGPEAIKSLPRESVNEIFAIFPELRNADYTPIAARDLPSGRKSRTLVVHHINNKRALVTS